MNKKMLILLLLALSSSASAVQMPDWRDINQKLSSVAMDDVCDSAMHVYVQGKDLACEYGSKVLTGVKEYYERVDAWTVAHPYTCLGGVVGAWVLMRAIMRSKIQHRNACYEAYDYGYNSCNEGLQYERYGRGNESEEN